MEFALSSGLVPYEDFSRKPRKLRQYYSERNRHIRDLLNVQNKTYEETKFSSNRMVGRVVRGCLAVNAFLCVLKIQVFVSSGSLAVLVSIVDSVLDLLSGGILWLTVREISKTARDLYRYPIGKSRFELVGTLVFSVVMVVSMIIVGFESLKALLEGLFDSSSEMRAGPAFRVVDLGIMSLAVGIKSFLYFLFRSLNRKRSSVVIGACTDDQRNDALMNLGGLAGGFLAGRFPTQVWWLDPAIGLLLAGIVSAAWIGETKIKIHRLTGIGADPSTLRKITLMIYNHDSRILKVDTVRAYYVGAKLFVEIHIVMDPLSSLRESHDVGETLERQIEQFFGSDVERAFVHLDYEWSHSPASEHPI